jgi:hypothetical protein
MENEPPSDTVSRKRDERGRIIWVCKVPNCGKRAQSRSESMCVRHFSEEIKRRRVCQETNNNELSQGNSDAHGNDNENCRTNNDDQSGAMVLAAFRCNVSNISETTHVPVSSPQQQRFNSTVEEPSDNQTVDERVTYDNATQGRVATDEAPDVGDQERQEETTDEQIGEQPQRGNNSTIEEASENQTFDERVTYDNATETRVASNEAPDFSIQERREETTDEQIVEQPQRAGTNVYENDFTDVNRIPSPYAIFMERFNSLEEENRILRTRVDTLENSIENKNLTDRISDLEKKVEQLSRDQPFSFGTISPSHASDLQDFCTDNLIGTFDTFEHVEKKKPRTSNTHTIMLTRATNIRNAGLSNPDNLCYSNVIYQAFASCKQFTKFSNDPPSQNNDDLPLCYEFTTLLNSMINNTTVINAEKLTKLFQRHDPAFANVQGEYYISNPI